METFIIHALMGDYSHTAQYLEKLIAQQNPETKNTGQQDTHYPATTRTANDLHQENELLREELNELYLKYDRMTDAFAKIKHHAIQAAKTAENHFE